MYDQARDRLSQYISRPLTAPEIAVYVLLIVGGIVYLNYLNTLNPGNIYSSVLTPFLLLAATAVALSRVGGIKRIPIAIAGFGDPSEKVFGLPRPVLAAVAGFALMLVLRSAVAQDFSAPGAVIDSDSFTKVALGNGAFEELAINGFLMPTLAVILIGYGLAAGLLVVMLLSLYFLPLSLVFPFIIVGLALMFVQSKFEILDTRKNAFIALILAVLIAAAFFGLLHTRVAGGDLSQTVQYAKFALVANVGNVLSGSLAFGMAFHILNNSLCPGANLCASTGPQTWLPSLVFLALLLFLSYARLKLPGRLPA